MEANGILTHDPLNALNMLQKATLTQLETLESLAVLWNPPSYSVTRMQRLAAPASLGAGPASPQLATGALERFSARLLLDSTEKRGAERDLRKHVERVESWARPDPFRGLPPSVLFQWGPFRFRGVIELLNEEWVLFDPDGTPIRGWLDVTLRR